MVYEILISEFPNFIKPLSGFSDYAIDKMGVIYRGYFRYGRNYVKTLKPFVTNGYRMIDLCKDGIRYRKKIARLVLETFVGKCPNGMESCHNNSIRADDRLENLRWDTHKNNCADRKKYKILIEFLSPYTAYTYRCY